MLNTISKLNSSSTSAIKHHHPLHHLTSVESKIKSLSSDSPPLALQSLTTINKMNLSSNSNVASQQLGLNLNLNLSTSSDSSSGGGGSSGGSHVVSNNNNQLNSIESLQNNLHNQLSNFHNQQYQQQQVESIEANKGYTFEEQFKQLYELDDDPKRKEFLDDLFQFMAERNQPVNRIPIMAKHVLDLYELYNLVVARGGLVEVINKKIWREITKGLNLPSTITSAAFTLRTQYMKYLYPYECAKNNFSHQDELQQAIDGNRREGRRAGAGSLGGYGSYLGPGDHPSQMVAAAAAAAAAASSGGHYSASPSPNHLFANAGHNLLSQVQSAVHQHQSTNQQQQQPLQLHQDSRDLQRPQSGGSSNESPTFNNQQRLYQDSIESDHEDDEESIDLGHSSKRNSPIVQHLDPHNNRHLNQQQATEQQQQQLAAAAAAAAALRQQLGAAINFAGNQNFLGQLTSQTNQTNGNQNITNTGANQNQDLVKQQQEQFLAALMAATNNQQQQQQSQPQQPPPQPNNTNPDQQAAARAALSMMASNAMLITASNAPDAMAMATAAQAIGVKGAFIILLL